MITDEERKLFQNEGYSFEEIQHISDSNDAINRGEVIGEKEFWDKIYSKINAKMKEKCI